MLDFLNLRLMFIIDMCSSASAVQNAAVSVCVCVSGTCDKWSEMHSVVSRSVIRGVIQRSDAQINVIWLSEG